MASFQQVNYCKNCKTNVSVNEKGQCKKCNSTLLNKTWSVRFRYVNEEQKEIQKRLSGFSTKKEANEEYLKFMATAKQFQKLDKQSHDLTFAELYEEFKEFQKSRIKESSYYDLCSKINLHILPYFNKYKVKEITPKIILQWQNSINNYSYKYKVNLRTYLSSILKYAEKYYQIINQLKNVDGFRNVDFVKEMSIWTPEEFYQFIEHVTNFAYKAYFYSLYFTGARKGEILATTWQDWDLEAGTLTINKTVSKKVFGKQWTITSPKNNSSVRKIQLSNNLICIMKEYRDYYKNLGLDGLVFYGDKPFADSSTERKVKEACDKANVKKIRIHDFRHSHASYLLGNGISAVAVSKRLGHSSVKQTFDTYAHLIPQESNLIIKLLNSL